MAGRPGRTPPQPATAARKGKAAAHPARKAAAKPTVLGRVFARPGVIVAGASFAAIMTGIVANALVLQKGHHPSPLFSPAASEIAQPAAVPLPPPAPRQVMDQSAAVAPDVPAPAATVEAAPQALATPAPLAKPQVAPAPHGAAKKPATQPATHPAIAHKSVDAPAHKDAAVSHKAAPVAHRDPIAQLLGKGQ